MKSFSQGDILKIEGFRFKFLVVSKNAYIRSTRTFHVCPLLNGVPEGPLHIAVTGEKGECGVVHCEQIKLIDSEKRACTRIDRLHYRDIMEISDALQGIFEYD